MVRVSDLPLRTSLGVSTLILGLLLWGVVFPKASLGWLLKPVGGWLTVPQPVVGNVAGKLVRDVVAGVVCAIGCVREALATIERERECVATERDAFEEFADTVETLPTKSRSVQTSVRTLSSGGSEEPDQLHAVRDCYRETVMAVPNYEADYGESLHENVAAEFGGEVAAAVTGEGELTPQLQGLLVAQATTAAQQRQQLLDKLETEHESISEARTQLQDIGTVLAETAGASRLEQSFSELVRNERRLRRAEERCEELLRSRQHEIHRQAQQFRGSDMFLQEYLNTGLGVTFPVLDGALQQLGALREKKHAVTRAITRRY